MLNNINMNNSIPLMNNNMINYVMSEEDEEWMKGFRMGEEKKMIQNQKLELYSILSRFINNYCCFLWNNN